MNIANTKKFLPMLLKNNIVPFLWGTKGIGKTETVEQLAKEMGLGFIALELGTQSDMGDLLGLLKHNPDGTVSHARPEWMPTEGNGIIFLDEFNRAHPDVLQGMYSFLTKGTIHTHKLPPGWKIVAAGNYQNNNFTVTDMSDQALNSRFCHIDFRPDVAEFINHAETKGAFSVASFIREQPSLLGLADSKQTLDTSVIKPDPRAWLSKLGQLELEDLGDCSFEIYSGCVGQAAAAAFMAHKKKTDKAVSITEVLENYDKVQKRVLSLSQATKGEEARFDLLNTACSELIVKLDTVPDLLVGVKLTNLQSFLMDIPKELAMKVFQDMHKVTFTGKNDIINNPAFIERYFGHKKVG